MQLLQFEKSHRPRSIRFPSCTINEKACHEQQSQEQQSYEQQSHEQQSHKQQSHEQQNERTVLVVLAVKLDDLVIATSLN